MRRTLAVSITSDQDAMVRACLQSGRHATASEVIRAALRLLDREEGRPSTRLQDITKDGKVRLQA